MELRWSPAAAEDLFRIIEYIRQENVPAARRIAKTIYESAASLKSFPNKGRAAWKERVNFHCHHFLLLWFIESAGILWKSQTSSMGRRNGRRRIEGGRPEGRPLHFAAQGGPLRGSRCGGASCGGRGRGRFGWRLGWNGDVWPDRWGSWWGFRSLCLDSRCRRWGR